MVTAMRRTLTSLLALFVASPAFAVGGFNGDNFGKPGFSQYSSGVAAPTTPMIQPVMASTIIAAVSGSRYTTITGSTASGGTSATANRAIPIPVNAAISGIAANVPAAATTGAITDYIIPSSNVGALGTVTCPLASTANCLDSSGHTDSLTAGDSLQVVYSASAAWTTGNAQNSLLATPTDGVSGFFAALQSLGTLSAPSYVGMSIFSQSATANTTEVDASSILPVGITLTGLFADPNGTSSSGTAWPIINVCKNGTCSGVMTCPLVASSSIGCCVNTTGIGHVPRTTTACGTTTSVHYAVGDTISIQYTCSTAGSCTSAVIGVSLSYIPDNAGQSVLAAQPYSNVTASSWAAIHEYQLSTVQGNYNMLPYMNGKTAYFSNMIACTETNPGGAGNSRTFTSQLGSVPGSAPGTVAGTTSVQLGGGNGACTGANSGVLLGGGQDTSDTWTATAGQTIDYVQTVVGGPVTGNHTFKLSQAVVVQ